VLVGLDHLAPSLNLWRHELQWVGGLGIIVMALAVLPLLGVGGLQLYKGGKRTGPVKDDKLAPRIAETARSLWLVYTLITAVGIVALRVCGMSWFDAICHAFSAVGLGGFFHPRCGAWVIFNSAPIEFVVDCADAGGLAEFWRAHFVALRRLSLEPYAP